MPFYDPLFRASGFPPSDTAMPLTKWFSPNPHVPLCQLPAVSCSAAHLFPRHSTSSLCSVRTSSGITLDTNVFYHIISTLFLLLYHSFIPTAIQKKAHCFVQCAPHIMPFYCLFHCYKNLSSHSLSFLLFIV